MSDFTGAKVVLTSTTDAARITEAQVTATFKSLLRTQESLEHIQQAIAQSTYPTVTLSLSQIDTKIAALT
jgi:hypothetical protein